MHEIRWGLPIWEFNQFLRVAYLLNKLGPYQRTGYYERLQKRYERIISSCLNSDMTTAPV